MKNQHKKIFKGKMMKNELVSVDVIHAEGEHLTADEYRRVEIEQLMQRVIDQQAEARAIRARMQAESVANSVALHYGLFPFAFAHINEQPAPVFNKGDRVYVKFAIDKFEIIDGNSYRVNGGFFEGDGVIDRAEDDYLYGRLDDGRPFMCKPSDVTRLAIIDGTAEDSKGLNKSLLFIFLIIGALALKVFL